MWGPCGAGKELAIFHDPRLEPGFDLATDARGRLRFGQQRRMTDAIETFRNIDFQHVLGPKDNTLEDRFDGIPAGASGAKAIGMWCELGFPGGFQGLARQRLPRSVMLGGNPERALLGTAPLRNPSASQWRGGAIKPERCGQPHPLLGGEGFDPINARRVSSPIM